MVVSVENNEIGDYQLGGVVVNEDGAYGKIRKNVITGLGATAQTSQYGIQVGFGADAKISKNTVSNNAVPTTQSCVFDGGNLIYEANGGKISKNTFIGNTAGVFVKGSKNKVYDNTMNGLSGSTAAGLDGVLIIGDRNKVRRNTILNASAAGVRLLGSKNKIENNTITGTRASLLCDSLAASVDACADLLDTCGVGIWVMQGERNKIRDNTLSDNDSDMVDDGFSTRVRRQ